MKTFYEFVDHKNLEASIIEAANLMVEMDIDPQEFIIEYLSKDSELQEGFMDTIKNIGKGAMAFGQNVWSGGGIRGGLSQAKDMVMGPGAKFDSAVNSLTALIDTLEKNDQTKNMMNAGGTQTLSKWINMILNALKKERDAIPRMQSAANTQPQYAQKSGAPAGGSGTPSGGSGTPSGAPAPVPRP
jgi:hypothetical protein